MAYTDIMYQKENGKATITINRPERYNAFTAKTLEEIHAALRDAWVDKSTGVVVLTGRGDKAFCTGGDQKSKDADGYKKEDALLDLLEAHDQVLQAVRSIPKPVIAMVNGYAIGGGNVLQAVCDVSIASDTAKFGQAGPRVGSFDAGFGTIYLARIIGEKKAREMWYLCRQYSAREALEMGLINKVVPSAQLHGEVDTWCWEILQKSPYALAYLKASFNADTDHVYGINVMSGRALGLFYQTDESHEGASAFLEKRPPDFNRFRR
jgi:naphthoate synthase